MVWFLDFDIYLLRDMALCCLPTSLIFVYQLPISPNSPKHTLHNNMHNQPAIPYSSYAYYTVLPLCYLLGCH